MKEIPEMTAKVSPIKLGARPEGKDQFRQKKINLAKRSAKALGEGEGHLISRRTKLKRRTGEKKREITRSGRKGQGRVNVTLRRCIRSTEV